MNSPMCTLVPLMLQLSQKGDPQKLIGAFVEAISDHFPGAAFRYEPSPATPGPTEFELRTPQHYWGCLIPIEDRFALSDMDQPEFQCALQMLIMLLELQASGGQLKEAQETRRLLEMLRQSEARFRAMVENLPAGAVLRSGEEIYINRAVVAITGYTAEQLRTLPDWFEKLYGAEATRVRQLWESDRQNTFQKPWENWIRRSDGVLRFIQFYAYGWEEGDLAKEVWLLNDVTDRARAMETLRESESRYRLLAENMRDVVWYLDLATLRYLYVSPSVIKLRGFTAEEVMAQSFAQSLTHASFAHVSEQLGRLLPLVDPARPETCNAVMELEMPCKDGRTVWTEVASVALFNDLGGVDRVVGVTRDITERKRAAEERARIEDQMRQAQKLESLGVLAGGIAHDFNNLLMAVMGNIEMVRDCLPTDSVGHRYLKSAEKASQRATELCGQMLAYAGRGTMSIQPLNLSRCIEETVPMLEVSISKKARLVLELNPELPAIDADSAQLQQVIMNLIINASEALEESSGEIRLRTWVEAGTRENLQGELIQATLPEGAYVWLSVSDTGCGMDEVIQKRMFDPFFTTKFAGRGLGLPAVLGIVRSHHGTVRVKSHPGTGTVFTLAFPARKDADVSGVGKGATRRGWQGKGTILVVDDEPHVREVSCLLLARLGFQTRVAAEGGEALALLESSADQAALPVAVILDVTMPGIDGVEAFGKIQARWPAIPIVISSGFQAEDCLKRFKGNAPAGFLKKPYSSAQLEALLKKILE